MKTGFDPTVERDLSDCVGMYESPWAKNDEFVAEVGWPFANFVPFPFFKPKFVYAKERDRMRARCKWFECHPKN